MKKKKLNFVLLALAFIFCTVFLAGCSTSESEETENIKGYGKNISVKFSQVDNQYSKISQIYKQSFQDKIHKEIETIKKSKNYTIDAPLIISNPYCTITDGLYVYFKTSEKVQIQYTVKTAQYGDYTGTVYENSKDNLSTEHETTLIGIVPGVKNNISLTIIDKKGKIKRSVNFSYDAPTQIGKFDTTQAVINKGSSTQKLSNGLYTILGDDLESSSDSAVFVAMYDNKGVLRCEIPLVSYRAHRLLFKNNCMFFSINHTHIVSMEKTGYINRIYSTGNYELHHDYIFGNNNDILLLGNDPNATTKEDKVLDLDLNTGSINKLIDYRSFFKNYYSETSLPFGKSQIDWMHINSLALTKDGKLLVSSRETSTIMEFENIYGDNCTLDYMLGSPNFWAGTGYENLLFKASGNFSLHAGQHNITYISDNSLKDGQYYLTLFNNNNTYSATRPSYNWLSDTNYNNTGVADKKAATYSYYYKYLVDENKKTYKLVKKIAVPYSAYVSGIQNLKNGNILIDSGSMLTAYEYDKKDKLIQSITVGGNKWTYRIIKYNFKGFWFQ